jgi:hypothetical protein
MNDPTVLEASRVLAQNLMKEDLSSDLKIKTAFHRIICRIPGVKENEILKSYYEDQLKQFRQKQLDASSTLHVGEFPFTENLDMNETAALMKVINMIYNMEEAIIKS